MKPKCMALITSPLTRFSYDKENSKSPGCEKLELFVFHSFSFSSIEPCPLLVPQIL